MGGRLVDRGVTMVGVEEVMVEGTEMGMAMAMAMARVRLRVVGLSLLLEEQQR